MKNDVRVRDDRVAEVELGNGKVALVDEVDLTLIGGDRWYAMTSARYPDYWRVVNGGRPTRYLHRVIMSPPEGMVVDHINHDPLDNRRNNLRVCSHAENIQNRMKWERQTSRYKGVSRAKGHRRWRARAKVEGTYKHLGYFDTEEEAACAYDKAAIAGQGEFACLNFPLAGGRSLGS